MYLLETLASRYVDPQSFPTPLAIC
jgi:hypothetical protein